VSPRTLRDLIKLAVFVVVTLFLTVVLASTIGSFGISNTRSYKALFTDATALEKGDDVRVAGVKAGQVTGIKVVSDPTSTDGAKVAQVSIAVASNVTIHQGSELLQLRYRNLVGQRYIALTPGSVGPEVQKGETIPLSQTKPALDLTLLLNGFKPLFRGLTPEDVNRLSYEIIQTLQGEGGTVDTLVAHTASLTNTIADKDAVVGSVIDNLDTVLTTVAQRDGELSDLVVQLQRLVSGLAQDRHAISDSLQGIDDLATATIGLLHPARPLIQADVQQLGKLTKVLSDTRDTIDKELKILPVKLNQIIRTATYGGWFNFYLCAGDGHIILPDGTTIDVSKIIQTKSAACAG
jgi:phospholipid/cholesterol/gamma-HCH transport system substrate-binding protein